MYPIHKSDSNLKKIKNSLKTIIYKSSNYSNINFAIKSILKICFLTCLEIRGKNK